MPEQTNDAILERLTALEQNIFSLERQLRELTVQMRDAVHTRRLQVDETATGGQNGALRISSDSGYVDVGPKNSEWSHFETDRQKYYFNREVRVDSGRIGSYDGDLVLSTGDQARVVVSHENGDVHVEGTALVLGGIRVAVVELELYWKPWAPNSAEWRNVSRDEPAFSRQPVSGPNGEGFKTRTLMIGDAVHPQPIPEAAVAWMYSQVH